MADKSTQRECNILFLGESQSGKSTLIECLKNYADPDYIINRLNIGDGIFSFTKNVIKTTIHTNLPTSHVLDKKEERVDYGKFLEGDQEDYEDELNDRRQYRVERDKSNSDQVTFNLYDTPGLNDTTLLDEKNIAIIFSALEKEKVPSINLVIITVANNPFTEDLQNSLKAYVNLLPDLNGNIVFVHTRIDYSKLHPKEELFVLTLQDKKRLLHELMGRDTVPHVLIDNDIGSTRVIRNCMTQNRLRELLAMAKLNQPVAVRVMAMNKTVKMRIVDAILQEKFEVLIKQREETLKNKNKEEEEVLRTIGLIEADIIKHESDIQNIDRDLAFYDKDTLHLLYEERYDQAWSMLKLAERKTAMYYPGRILSNSPGFINHVLDHIDTQEHNIEVARQAGGVGENHWAVQFRRRRLQDGVYHVKIYVKKSKKFSTTIEKLRTRESVVKDSLHESKLKLLAYNDGFKAIKDSIQSLVNGLELDRYVLGRVSTQQVHSKVFHALVDADVYGRDDSTSARRLEKFYIKRRFGVDELERKFVIADAVPLDTSEKTVDGSTELDANEDGSTEECSAEFDSTGVKEANTRIQTSSGYVHHESQSPLPHQKFSILVLGKSQSGKTALIQHIKNYADLGHSIDLSLLGDGVLSKTERPCNVPVKSSLQTYTVVDNQTAKAINLEDLGSKYKNEEDYQDYLLSSKTDVDLRLAEDKNEEPLSTMLFEFLDTPGLCNHEDKDSVQAIDIIDGIVAARSFNLILVVINPHDPLTAEQLLAFQYYSKVLSGLNDADSLRTLHSNIAFVFTHVDYVHSRTTNTDHHLALKEKVHSLSRIFKGYISDDFVPCPSFTVDLRLRRPPIIQCLIWNTLKQILQLATSRPRAPVNTTIGQVERTKHIPHPSNFSDAQRRAELDRIHGEPPSQSKPDVKQEGATSNDDPDEINILLIGDAQSDKTSLIKTMELYAEPGSVTHEEFIVRGSNGAADEIMKKTSFRTDLHTLRIRALISGHHHVVDTEKDARSLSQDAFNRLLDLERGNVETSLTHTKLSRECTFTVFEAPGFRATENLQRKILAIYKTAVESQIDVHHVLVALAPDPVTSLAPNPVAGLAFSPITSTTRTFISGFSNLFPNICQHMTFVHTKVDYHHLHISNTLFRDSIKDKEEQIQRLTKKPLSIFMIDASQHDERPIQEAMSQNVVHAILQATTLNRPDCSVLTMGKPKHSVLVLGQTQSGKSTLVQHIKKYADPLYDIDQSFLGRGNQSETVKTLHFVVDTDLPTYEARHNATGTTDNLQDLYTRFDNKEDYNDLLNARGRDYTTAISPQDNPSQHQLQLVEFKFLDTPGLNDTKCRDVKFARMIIDEIIRIQSFNLILVLVSVMSPISLGYRFALEYYSKILEGLHSKIAFLYTKIDYADCHRSNAHYHSSLATRHHVFSSIFRNCSYALARQVAANEEGHMEYKHFTINMDSCDRPIRQCLTQNTLRDILRLAVVSDPAVLETSARNLDRINAIVHPEEGNLAYRNKYRKDNPTRILPKPRAESGSSTDGSIPYLPAGEAEASAGLMQQDVAESDNEEMEGPVVLTGMHITDPGYMEHSPREE